MKAIFSNPKTTLLGILLGILYALAAMISQRGSLNPQEIVTALIPALLGALMADPSSVLERFTAHWRTTLAGIVAAAGSLLSAHLTSGQVDLKAYATALIIAAAGVFIKDGSRDAPVARPVLVRDDAGRRVD